GGGQRQEEEQQAAVPPPLTQAEREEGADRGQARDRGFEEILVQHAQVQELIAETRPGRVALPPRRLVEAEAVARSPELDVPRQEGVARGRPVEGEERAGERPEGGRSEPDIGPAATAQGAPAHSPSARRAEWPGGYCAYHPCSSTIRCCVVKNSGSAGGRLLTKPAAKMRAWKNCAISSTMTGRQWKTTTAIVTSTVPVAARTSGSAAGRSHTASAPPPRRSARRSRGGASMPASHAPVAKMVLPRTQ